MFGGAYIRRGLSTEGNLRFKIGRASLIVGSKGLYLEGQLNGGCFALPFGGGAYFWRGLHTAQISSAGYKIPTFLFHP